MLIRQILLLVFFLLMFSALYGQSLQGWLIYFGNTQLGSSRFSIHHEVQLRDYEVIGDHQQSLFRTGLQYKLSSAANVTMGYAGVYTELEGAPNKPYWENRIYQEAIIRQHIANVRLRHRFRFEERFVQGQDFRTRARYCLFLDIPIHDKTMMKGAFYGALYEEIFIQPFHKNLSTFDRNRLYGGVGYKVSDNLGVQLGYMMQHVGKNKGTNHVLLSFHHQLRY
ncbi:DUF2490 domain-containing protein [Sphingobacterium psychroaquaticum]|uniref:DUF2490 domain-containing protein n=1 Tax=Sphingobacterium psychroaquaticum TaxID=561061 RepID=A0A1X7L3J1_9SPHI|nr:DUF2490 domain-containing protein [Sphingobacterium psychroaquaticum]SMG47792.1 Protein of unknown function [Sphingobacterium psychroaquaticum]